MSGIPIRESRRLSPKPENPTRVAFGKVFTDHAFNMQYMEGEGWGWEKIVPTDELPAYGPASKVLHYGQGVFEGIKAFLHNSGHIAIFRLDAHLARMQSSAKRLSMAEIDLDRLQAGIVALVQLEKEWIPKVRGCSLYIRPVMFGTEPGFGVSVSSSYNLSVILCPVSGYYGSAAGQATRILVSEAYTRSAVGGTGQIKAIGNYAGSLIASEMAAKQGYDQVLWLDAAKMENVEEVGTMNIFFVIDGRIVTPRLTGSIMPGITRDSVIGLAPRLGFEIEQRDISIREVIDRIADGGLTECFGTGTAVSVCPVGTIGWKGTDYRIGTSGEAPVTRKLYESIQAIQYGGSDDVSGWLKTI